MAGTLKILILEDSATDAEIVRRLLVREKVGCEFSLATNQDAFLKALDQFHPDVILADNSLPQFDAREALKIVQGRGLPIPFILVTGTVSEEFAAGIIKSGADDYILKDRLIRLPAAIDAAIKQRRAEKENRDALAEIRKSNDRFQTLSKATNDAVWDWDLLTDRIWWNESFFTLFGYDPKLVTPDLYEWTKRIHADDREKVTERLAKIKNSDLLSWEDELRFQLPDGSYGTVLDRAYIMRDHCGKPVRAIGVFVDISEQKRLMKEMQRMEEEQLISRIEQQKEISRVILQTQEMERNEFGRELHDNINQILASVKLKLGYYLEEPEGNLDIIENCRQSLLKAIEETRSLSHHLVMPRFSETSLQDELGLLIENFDDKQLIQLETRNLHEKEIPSPIKESLFRIVQEQLTNIHKHAKADRIMLQVGNNAGLVALVIADNGVGFDMRQKRKGIGITNIFNRVQSYNGTADLVSSPGNGCILSVKIPLTLSD